MLLEQQIQKAHKLYTDENYKEALSIYDNIFSKITNPSLELVKKYAVCLQERLRYMESMKLTLELLEQKPDDTSMLLNYCICLGKQNRHKEALQQYEKILSIDSKFINQLGYYAYLLERTGNNEKADYYYKKALAHEPQNLWYTSHYAFFLQKNKRYKDSEFYYKKAIESDTNNTWLVKRYAFFIAEMRGKEFAYSYYDDLIKKDPHNYNYFINMVELALIFQDEDKAFEYLDKADKLEKPLVMDIILLFYKGTYFVFKKDYEKVKTILGDMSLLRKEYKSYIHRDLTDLNNFIEKNLNSNQRYEYSNILVSLN